MLSEITTLQIVSIAGSVASIALSFGVLVGEAGGWRHYRSWRVAGPLVLAAIGVGVALWATDQIDAGQSSTPSWLDAPYLTLYVALLAVLIALVGIPLALRRSVQQQNELLSRVTPYLRASNTVPLTSLSREALERLDADLLRLEGLLLRFPDHSSADNTSLGLVRSLRARVAETSVAKSS